MWKCMLFIFFNQICMKWQMLLLNKFPLHSVFLNYCKWIVNEPFDCYFLFTYKYTYKMTTSLDCWFISSQGTLLHLFTPDAMWLLLSSWFSYRVYPGTLTQFVTQSEREKQTKTTPPPPPVTVLWVWFSLMSHLGW